MTTNGNLTGNQAYTLQSEAQKIYNSIRKDPRLNLPKEIRELADRVHFVGDETQPFFPVPVKCAESQAGLLGYIGLLALAIAKDRYKFDQHVEVDVAKEVRILVPLRTYGFTPYHH